MEKVWGQFILPLVAIWERIFSACNLWPHGTRIYCREVIQMIHQSKKEQIRLLPHEPFSAELTFKHSVQVMLLPNSCISLFSVLSANLFFKSALCLFFITLTGIVIVYQPIQCDLAKWNWCNRQQDQSVDNVMRMPHFSAFLKGGASASSYQLAHGPILLPVASILFCQTTLNGLILQLGCIWVHCCCCSATYC